MTDPLHIMIATPCYGGLVTQRYMQSVCALLVDADARGIAFTVELLGYESLITRGRNALVSTFISTKSATHLFFIDADIGFSAAQAFRMLGFDRGVVAGMYPLKVVHYGQDVEARVGQGESRDTAQLRYVGTPLTSNAEDVEGFVRGEYAGAGFLLIKREVIMQMIKAYPETHFTAMHTSPSGGWGGQHYALFETMIEPRSRHYLSEDYAFCRRWRDLGGDLWLDAQSQLCHVGAREFAGDLQARAKT